MYKAYNGRGFGPKGGFDPLVDEAIAPVAQQELALMSLDLSRDTGYRIRCQVPIPDLTATQLSLRPNNSVLNLRSRRSTDESVSAASTPDLVFTDAMNFTLPTMRFIVDIWPGVINGITRYTHFSISEGFLDWTTAGPIQYGVKYTMEGRWEVPDNLTFLVLRSSSATGIQPKACMQAYRWPKAWPL